MRALTLFVTCLVLSWAAACSSGTRPQVGSLPPQTLSPLPPPDSGESETETVEESGSEGPASRSEAAPDEGAEAASRSEAAPGERAEGRSDAKDAGRESEGVEVRRGLIVLEDGGVEEVSQEDMISQIREASQRETERRKSAPPPVVVITDKNLAEMAEGGKVTIAEAPPDPGADALGETLEQRREEEIYWRTQARDVRERWRDAYDRTEALEAEAARLRERFYLEDDPFVRDGQIKPEWDRVLDELDEAREETEAAQAELEILLDEGRRAGALPGWLREGIELEPPPPERPESLPEQDVREPTVVREPPR